MRRIIALPLAVDVEARSQVKHASSQTDEWTFLRDPKRHGASLALWPTSMVYRSRS